MRYPAIFVYKIFLYCTKSDKSVYKKTTMIGKRIRQLREADQMLLRELAAKMQLDTAMLSKMERSERPFKKEDIIQLAEIFNQPQKELITLWLADRILKTIAEEEHTIESLELALNIAKNNPKNIKE